MEKQPLCAACSARKQWTRVLESVTPSCSIYPCLDIVGSIGAEQNPHPSALGEHAETLLKRPLS